jgi:glutamate carboxypeptidase
MQKFKTAEIDTEALVRRIEALAAIESPTSHPDGVDRVREAVAQMFRASPAVLETIEVADGIGRALKVTCDPGANEPGILVLAHMDTVHPLGTLANDLPLRREGDRLYGPGVYDMKGGLVVAAAAYLSALENGARRPLPVTFLFTPDEEIGSIHSRPLIEREAVRHKYVLVAEPCRSGGKVITQRKGLGRFTVSARGRPAHAGSWHQEGRSAIKAMARIVLEIEGWTDYGRGITTSVGIISGGTGVNVIPERCTIKADMRVCDMTAGEELQARFRGLRSPDPDVELTVEGYMHRPPFVRDDKVEHMFAAAASVAKELDYDLESADMVGGGSDGNLTAAKGVPTLDGLGVDGAGAHTLHEHLLISSIERQVRLIQGLLETLE